RQEMPQLLDLADRGIRLVGVNYRDTRENGLAFLNEFGDPFAANIFDPEGELGFELGVIGAPETFVVDAQGVIRYHHKGYVSPEDVHSRLLPEVEKWR
ncbi:MAG: redoxin domain-containing protein, partial [Halomonas sp.]|nr:redoxin domain-containing protein [Halomonas sp.]